jgi:DNA-binding transcriptional regulator YiaG
MTTPAQELRELMRGNGLTQPDVAQLASVSLKSVESWLADPGAANYRRMHARHLKMIRAMLPGYLAAKSGRKA